MKNIEDWLVNHPFLSVILSGLIIGFLLMLFTPFQTITNRWFERNFPPEKDPLVTKFSLTRDGSEKNFVSLDSLNSKDKIRIYVSHTTIKNTGNTSFHVKEVWPILVGVNEPEQRLTNGDSMDDIPEDIIQPGGSAKIRSVARIPESFLNYKLPMKLQLQSNPKYKNQDLRKFINFPVITEVKIKDWSNKEFTGRIESVFIDYEGNELIPDPPTTLDFK